MNDKLYRFDWSAAFAGLAVGLTFHMVLTLLGFALGAWTPDKLDAAATAVALGAGIWNAISMIISAFVGAYVMGRLSLPAGTPYLQALIVWGIAWSLFAIFATTLSAWVGGVFGMFRAGFDANVTPMIVLRAGSAALWLFVTSILALGATVYGLTVGYRAAGDDVSAGEVPPRRRAVAG